MYVIFSYITYFAYYVIICGFFHTVTVNYYTLIKAWPLLFKIALRL